MRFNPPPRPARDKIQSAAALTRLVRRAQAVGRTVVFTNGCFDLLHAGHIKLLERARTRSVGVTGNRLTAWAMAWRSARSRRKRCAAS